MLLIYIKSIFLIVGVLIGCNANSTIVHLNETIEYYVNRTEESLDLTIHDHLPLENCTHSFLTLVDVILLYSSIIQNTTILAENITTLTLSNLCVYIDIENIEKLESIRRLIFENCTIRFLASQEREDYDFYPKNLSRWSFNQGRTDTFDQFIDMINYIGPLKVDLKLSDCFEPIYSFEDFIPLDTEFILLNITCDRFQIDEPSDIKTRTAIFLTPILIINTQLNPCPSIDKYRWLSLKRSQTKLFSLRMFTCENRLIQLNFDINQTTSGNTKTTITTLTSFIQSTTPNKWTALIVMNFSVVLISIIMLFIAFTIFLIRFVKNKSTI